MTTGAAIVTYNPKLTDLTILVNNIIATVRQVVLVDNGSDNLQEIEMFAAQFLNVKVIVLGENKGIGYAQNIGINDLFSNKEINGVVLFDHDSHPEPDMIAVLANEHDRLTANNAKIGALGPIFMDPRTQNNYPISVFSGFSLIKKYPLPGDSEPIAASFLISSGSLISRDTINKVGMMNEDFFIDYIDIEWSFRAKFLGFDSFACPNAKMYHQVGDSRMKVLGREISIHSPIRRYYLARNSIFMIKIKYINWKYKVREIFYSISRVIIFVAFVNKRVTYLKYIFKGWYDGLTGKMGKFESR